MKIRRRARSNSSGIDLDDAARRVARIGSIRWYSHVRPGKTLWRSEAGEFLDRRFRIHRSMVARPYSLNIPILSRRDEQIGGILLYRGGWVDLWLLTDGHIESDSREISSASEFEMFLQGILLSFTVNRHRRQFYLNYLDQAS
ncbi:MAG: hypothetical protein JWN95_651 [Frankiales bacterium]|nr:hypothetical protein [Frankiales bacterium]